MAERSISRETMWTPANIVTLIRICLVPVFVAALLSPWPEWFGLHDIIDDGAKSLVAAGVFIFISCTDWLDGYLARKRDEVTDFGKFVDPLADKILVAAALLALIELQVLPAWPVLIILAREFIVSGVRMIAASKNEVIAASWYGKAKTVAQIVAIVLFLVKDSLFIPTAEYALHNPLYIISWLAMLIALALTIISMLDYISKARHLLGFKPSRRHGTSKGSSSGATDADLSNMAMRAIEQAIAQGVTLGCAESLTGGMVACALTSVPGSSKAFLGGIASYAYRVKERLLGVDEQLLESQGAVNMQTADQMAKGARKALGADITVALTGIAGPGGAEPEKPVGTVFMALCTPQGAEVRELRFSGDRDDIRRAATFCALEALTQATRSS